MIALPKITVEELSSRYTSIVVLHHDEAVHLLATEPEVYEIDYGKDGFAGWVYLFTEWDVAVIATIKDFDKAKELATDTPESKDVIKANNVCFDIDRLSANNYLSYDEIHAIHHVIIKGFLRETIGEAANRFLYR